MRSLRTVALGIVALSLAACSTTTPGWTYAPAPAITPPPSVDPSASAPSASEGAPGAGSAAPGGSATATVVNIAALNIEFDQSTLTVPAGQPFQIVFANNDAGVPHNVAIHEGSPTGAEVWKGELFNGVETRTYDVPALTAGTYGFVCTVHPNMIGTLAAG